MEFVCEARTTGGPVAIMTLNNARKWNGVASDYWLLTENHSQGLLQYFELPNRCCGCLFYQETDGDFLVYCQTDAILVLTEWTSPDEAQSIERMMPNFDPYTRNDKDIYLQEFGGKVVVFDSSAPGILISLSEPGYEKIDLCKPAAPTQSPSETPDAILVEVEQGSWQVFEIHRKDESYECDGVLFRRVGQ